MKLTSITPRHSFFLALYCLVGLFGWSCTKKASLDPTQNKQEDEVFLVDLQANPSLLAPGDSALVQAVLLNQLNKPVAGEVVQFSTTIGNVSPTSDTTDGSGTATTVFIAPGQTGRATITSTYEDQDLNTTIDVFEKGPQSGTLWSDNISILADGVSFTAIYSLWLDEFGQPLNDVPVTFVTTLGTIKPSAMTDASGIAVDTLFSTASRVNGIANVTASRNGIEETTQVLFKGINFSLSASPTNIRADGRSTASITAVLKETSSTFAIPDVEITFGADLGTIPNKAATNASGVATVQLTSSTQTGVSSIIAVYGQTLTETVQVPFVDSTPTYLNVTAEPPVIVADNQSASLIRAVVSDQNNNPVPDGTQVNFEIIAGSGSIESIKTTTEGTAVSSLTSGTQPDTAVIVVQVNQLTATTTVRYVVGEAQSITIVSDSTSLPADGITSTRVVAYVYDSAGNPVVDGTRVTFTADIGDITPIAQTNSGQAVAQFSSSVTGIATITASAGAVLAELTIQLRPGAANSILLSYDPKTLGVKDSGRNQTITITAEVIDSKNNPAIDGTLVTFSIFSSPRGGESLSSTEPIPTLNGRAQVSLNSGIRSGSVRILAEVTDDLGVPIVPDVRAVSTEIIIFAGPPYIEDVNDRRTSHLTVGVSPLNIRGWDIVNNIATVTALVGDKYNNPVPPGTAVYFTTTGGVIFTEAYTDEFGVATVTIHTGQPLPDVIRFYNTSFVSFDPNESHANFTLPTNVIPGPIPDFDLGEVLNSVGSLGENDGITRILAVTEGVDADSISARTWAVTGLVFSGAITTFDIQVSSTNLAPGQSAAIDFKIYDINGNPIVGGSEISILANSGELSWVNLVTGDPGITHYQVLLTNDLDPNDPDSVPKTTTVTIVVNSDNGRRSRSSVPINLNLM